MDDVPGGATFRICAFDPLGAAGNATCSVGFAYQRVPGLVPRHLTGVMDGLLVPDVAPRSHYRDYVSVRFEAPDRKELP
jgi:hypothetical protein